MICPHCGAAALSGTARCSVCSRALQSARQVAAGVLTPVPPPAPVPDNEDTPGLTGGLTTFGETPAGFSLPSTEPDAPTTFAPASVGVDVDAAARGLAAPRAATTAGTGSKGPLGVGQSFGPRYHIIRELGVGGMGAVYQAWDEELLMAVALKVIRPEATIDPVAARELERRFKQELVLARKVTHKNVVRIHDLGELDGIKYITMPYLEGSDLASVLKREGKLSVAAALPIVRDVAAGLVAAHEAGIVHRDLKPANIMILSDHAVIMDFGIARSSTGFTPSSRPDGGVPARELASLRSVKAGLHSATVAGTVLGTVEYMAPEQAKGQPLDQRADLYALGLMFADMLLGRRHTPGNTGNPLAELMQRIKEPPPPVRTIDATIPEPIDRIITRCIQLDPAARFQTSAELVAELDRLDERGEPIPVKRVFGVRTMAAAAAVFLVLLVATWWFVRPAPAPVQHAPVSVLIADFENSTNDPAFDQALEAALRIALEGAGFIVAYDRTQMRNLGVPAFSGKLDEPAARRIAVGQGLGVVVSGSLDSQGGGYLVSIKATEAVTGNVIRTAQAKASNKSQVMAVTTKLTSVVRAALGDNTSESAQRFAMETLTTRSLDVIHEYALAMEALSNGKNDEARRRAAKAAELDPKFGSAYGIMAAASEGLDQHDEALQDIGRAVGSLGGVTERERYRIRGLSFLLTGDRQKCVEEYTALISRYSSDTAAHNNLAICSKHLRNMPKAVEEMRRAVAILPKRALYRVNLALYASYNSDFATGEQEAREVQKLNPQYPAGFNALAFAQLAQGRPAEAAETYGKLEAIRASEAAAGLGDLALYEGRLSDAARILEKGAAADVEAKNAEAAADKFAALAYTELTRGQKARAVAAAESALLNNRKAVKTRFLAARIFAASGEVKKARDLAAELAAAPQIEPQAYAKIIEGDISLERGNSGKAIKDITDANRLLDTWIGRFDLGRAYLKADLLLEADSEFDRCIKRRGEALALFLDEAPTFGYFPPVYYYLGRVREGLKSAGDESYRTYLDIRGKAAEDPLLPEIRRRAGR